jgi:hypothetical protein
MHLVVLNVAYPFARIGPDSEYEAERTIAQLDAALVRAGHESVVMACEGSITEGILLETQMPSNGLDDAGRQQVYDQYRFTLRRFLEKWPIDLIHMHGVDFYEYLPPPGAPVLVTLHSPLDHYPESVFHLERPSTFLNCVSSVQRRNCPACADLLLDVEVDEVTQSRVIERYIMIYDRLVNEFKPAELRVSEKAEISLAAR